MTAGGFDPRLTTYFGDATLQAGFLPLPNLFLRHYAELGLSGQQAMFLLQIMACTWDLGSRPQNLSQIAARMGIARRTAQGISAELHAKGLIEIYDQYDTGGAQIENGYNLGPLFARLSVFAPPSTPPGTQRQPRARAQAPVIPAARTSAPEALPPPAEICIPPQQEIASPPGNLPHPPPDPVIQAPRQEFARLNESKNLLKKGSRLAQEQQQQQVPAAAARQLGWIGYEEQVVEQGGRSMRWDEPLSGAEVRQTRQVLARIGLNADVADAVAPALHPAESWALWLYARISGLGPAWIASQLYDTRRQQPRMAGIPAPCDAAGRLLAAMPVDAAAAILDIIEKHGPDEQDAARVALATGAKGGTASEVQVAFEAAMSAAGAERQGRARGRPPQQTAAATLLSAVPAPEDVRWTAAKALLQAALPGSDYVAWIAPLVLLHAEEQLVVVGAPNCFVRSELQSTHAPAVQKAVEHAWGRVMAVDVVIETPVLA